MSRAGAALRFLATRLVAIAAIGLLVSFATFFALRLSRDPVAVVGAARDLTITDPAVHERLAKDLGTDRPLIVQYGDWLLHAVQGDFGQSYVHPENAVTTELAKVLPVNLELVLLAQIIALVVSVPLGLLAGARAGRKTDSVITAVATAFMSYPAFALAIVLIMVFAVGLNLFPAEAAGYVGFFEAPLHNLRIMFLPALSLAIGMIGVYTRVLRSDVATTLQEDFVLMARSRGLPPRRILLRHALRPSSLSLVSIVGLQSGLLLGGSILVEVLFAFPYGLGTMLVSAALSVDIPRLLAAATVIGVIFAAITIATDMLLRVIDPRISNA